MYVKKVSIIVVVGLLLLAQGAIIAQAESSAGFTIGIEVEADGSWEVVELLGQKVNLTPESFNGLASLLGLQMTLPAQALPPELTAGLMQAGVQQLTLATDGQLTRIWVNERFLPEVEINPTVLRSLVGDTAGFITQAITFLNGTAYVRLPSGESIHPDLSQTITRATVRETAVVNSAQLEATLSPGGRWLSAGGFTRADASAAGIAVPLDVDPALAAFLANYDQVEADISPNELLLTTDNEPAIRLIWDQDSRLALAEIVEDLLGVSLEPQVFATAETWLADSKVSVVLHVADEPQDGAPVIDVSTPIALALNGTDAPTIEGIPVYGLDPQVMGTVVRTAEFASIDQVQACWAEGHLYWFANGRAMPYATLGDGWLTTAIQLTGFQPLPAAGKIEQALASVTLPASLAVGPEVATSPNDCDAYQTATAQAPLAINVDATWTRQSDELALGKVDLPLLVPLDLSAKVRVPGVSAFVPASLTQVAASVGPAGIFAHIDDVDVSVHWDSALLSNVASVADGLGFGDVVRQVSQVVNLAEITVDIKTAESVASSPETRLMAPDVVASRLPFFSAAPANSRDVASTQKPAATAPEAAERSVRQAGQMESRATVQDQAVTTSQEQLLEPTQTREVLESATAPAAGVCVVPAGGTLWGCWVQFGGGQGTGMSWPAWSDAVVATNGLQLNREGVAIVQPGDTIRMLPTQ
ncbi:MAG: hypothetical protein ACE5HA_17935 [Anaerolineae bacterium]